MPQLQQPDVVGNFLSNYYTAQQKQQTDQDRARTMQRQDVQDQQAQQEHDWADLNRKNEIIARTAMSLTTPEAWDQAVPKVMQQLGLQGPPPSFAERENIINQAMSVKEQLAQKLATQKFALEERQTNAQIKASNAQAEAARALASQRAGGGGGPAAIGAGGGAGIPVGGQSTTVVTDPYAPLSSPKERDMFYRQEARTHEKISADARAAARAAAKTEAQMRQFRSLNERNSTGPTYGLPVIGPATTFLARSTNPDFANMEAITAAVAPSQRPPGSGATSDYDARQFERATVGVDKPGPANARIADAAIGQARRDREYAQFVDWYFQRTRTNQGMDQAWQEYVNANPIFDPEDTTGFGLNKNNVSWRDWFNGSASAPSPKANRAQTAPPSAQPTQPQGGAVTWQFDANGNLVPGK